MVAPFLNCFLKGIFVQSQIGQPQIFQNGRRTLLFIIWGVRNEIVNIVGYISYI